MEEVNSFQWIKDLAEQCFLNTWDWFAAIIAVSSLVIAISSLVIATKTLHSQKETQKNTAPLITISIQKMLWIRMIQQIHYKIKYLFALKILLEKNNYLKKPEDCFIQSFIISTDRLIHEELFYNEEEKFDDVIMLKEQILDYNRFFISAANKLNYSGFKNDTISRMFKYLNVIGFNTLKSYQSIFNENDKNKIIDKVFFDLNFFLDDKGKPFFEHNMDKNIENKSEYKEIDVFVNYFKDIGKEKYERFRTAYYEYIHWYASYLIANNKIVLEDL